MRTLLEYLNDEYKNQELTWKEAVKDSYDHLERDLGEDITVEAILDDITNNYAGFEHCQDSPTDTTQSYDTIVAILNRLGLPYENFEDYDDYEPQLTTDPMAAGQWYEDLNEAWYDNAKECESSWAKRLNCKVVSTPREYYNDLGEVEYTDFDYDILDKNNEFVCNHYDKSLAAADNLCYSIYNALIVQVQYAANAETKRRWGIDIYGADHAVKPISIEKIGEIGASSRIKFILTFDPYWVWQHIVERYQDYVKKIKIYGECLLRTEHESGGDFSSGRYYAVIDKVKISQILDEIINSGKKELTEAKRDVPADIERYLNKALNVFAYDRNSDFYLTFDYSGINCNNNTVCGGRLMYNMDGNYNRPSEKVPAKIATLKALGCTITHQSKRERAIEFRFDNQEMQNRIQQDIDSAEADYTTELQGVDIDQFRPDDATLNKLAERRANGKMENVNAIKTIKKLVTYYYAAKILGWNELMRSIRYKYHDLSWRANDFNDSDQFEWDDEARLDAIDRRVDAQADRQETRTPDQVLLQQTFRSVYDYLDGRNIAYTFTGRSGKYTLTFTALPDRPILIGERNARWGFTHRFASTNAYEFRYNKHQFEEEMIRRIQQLEQQIPHYRGFNFGEGLNEGFLDFNWPEVKEYIDAQFINRYGWDETEYPDIAFESIFKDTLDEYQITDEDEIEQIRAYVYDKEDLGEDLNESLNEGKKIEITYDSDFTIEHPWQEGVDQKLIKKEKDLIKSYDIKIVKYSDVPDAYHCHEITLKGTISDLLLYANSENDYNLKEQLVEQGYVSEEDLDEALNEDSHARFSKPEGDKVASYQNALKYANRDNTPYIYGYTNYRLNGKFFALDQPIKCVGDYEKDFRAKYKNCGTVYVARPNIAEEYDEDPEYFLDDDLEEDYIEETYSDDELDDMIGKVYNQQKVQDVVRKQKYGSERLYAKTVCTKCGREKEVFLSNLINDPEKYGSCVCSPKNINSKIKNIQGLFGGSKKIASNTSGYTGVSFVKTYKGEPYNKWRAYIEVDGVRTYLGDFDSKGKAIKARKVAGEKGIKWYKDNKNRITRDLRKRSKKYKNSKYRDSARKVINLKAKDLK